MTDLMERTEESVTAERKRLETIWWAGVFIWIGLTLAAEYLDILPTIGENGDWWAWFFVGVAPWTLGMNIYRAVSDAPDPSTWDWIWTVVFALVAIGTLVEIGGEIIGAVALAAVGAVILFRAVTRRE